MPHYYISAALKMCMRSGTWWTESLCILINIQMMKTIIKMTEIENNDEVWRNLIVAEPYPAQSAGWSESVVATHVQINSCKTDQLLISIAHRITNWSAWGATGQQRRSAINLAKIIQTIWGLLIDRWPPGTGAHKSIIESVLITVKKKSTDSWILFLVITAGHARQQSVYVYWSSAGAVILSRPEFCRIWSPLSLWMMMQTTREGVSW